MNKGRRSNKKSTANNDEYENDEFDDVNEIENELMNANAQVATDKFNFINLPADTNHKQTNTNASTVTVTSRNVTKSVAAVTPVLATSTNTISTARFQNKNNPNENDVKNQMNRCLNDTQVTSISTSTMCKA